MDFIKDWLGAFAHMSLLGTMMLMLGLPIYLAKTYSVFYVILLLPALTTVLTIISRGWFSNITHFIDNWKLNGHK